jgi:DNA-binding NarL/FixJ family response regulator
LFLQMPVLDGIGATRIITQKKVDQGQMFPKVVFLTAHALQDFEDQAAEVGGDGFIGKPFKLDTIKSMVQALMPGGGAGAVPADDGAVKVESPVGGASAVQGGSANELVGLLGGDATSRLGGDAGAPVSANDGAVGI